MCRFDRRTLSFFLRVLRVMQYAAPRTSLAPPLRRGNSCGNAPALRDAGALLAAFHAGAWDR